MVIITAGFKEVDHEGAVAEQQMLDKIRGVFESHGFCSIETPIVEKLEVLLSKSADTNKEMYVLGRLQADGPEEAKMGLRYDLTVPFAEFIALNKNNITFPFKRYEISKVFRDGPVKIGRDREFTQCDADVVGIKGQFIEAELLSLFVKTFKELNSW